MNKKMIFNPEVFITGHAYLVGDRENSTAMLLRYYGPDTLTFLEYNGHGKEYSIDDIDIENPIFREDLNGNYTINRFNAVKEICDMKDINELFTVGVPYKIISRSHNNWSRTNDSWFGLFLRYDITTNSLIFVQVKPENVTTVSIPIEDIENDEYIKIEALYNWNDTENNVSDIIRQQKVDGVGNYE